MPGIRNTAKNFTDVPDYNSDEFANFLLELAKAENLSGWSLLPSNDHAVYTISKHKKRLEKYYKVITPCLDVFENIYDKSKLLKVAQNCNVPIPDTKYFRTPNELVPVSLTFPVLTKGINGLTFFKALHRKAFIANKEDDLRKQLFQINDKYPIDKTFTQELIPSDGMNKTISFTAFCDIGTIKTFWMEGSSGNIPGNLALPLSLKASFAKN